MFLRTPQYNKAFPSISFPPSAHLSYVIGFDGVSAAWSVCVATRCVAPVGPRGTLFRQGFGCRPTSFRIVVGEE